MSRAKRHDPPPEHRTIQLVILFIGSVAVLLVTGSLLLVWVVLTKTKPTTASVAVLTSVTGLAGTAIGSLASMLVSTRPGSPTPPPTSITADPNATVTVDPPPGDIEATPEVPRRGRRNSRQREAAPDDGSA